MTKNLKHFLIFSIIWAAAFLAALLFGIHRDQATSSVYLSFFVVFVVVQTSVQRYLADHDSQRATRINLPACYAVISASASLIVTCGWLVAWRQSVWLVALAAIGSVIVVCLTAATINKGKIKATKKEDLFK